MQESEPKQDNWVRRGILRILGATGLCIAGGTLFFKYSPRPELLKEDLKVKTESEFLDGIIELQNDDLMHEIIRIKHENPHSDWETLSELYTDCIATRLFDQKLLLSYVSRYLESAVQAKEGPIERWERTKLLGSSLGIINFGRAIFHDVNKKHELWSTTREVEDHIRAYAMLGKDIENKDHFDEWSEKKYGKEMPPYIQFSETEKMPTPKGMATESYHEFLDIYTRQKIELPSARFLTEK